MNIWKIYEAGGLFWLTVSCLAFFVLPTAYLALCVWLAVKRTWWFTYIAYFFVFGSIGGWLLMLEVLRFGPYPWSPLPAFGMELFLITVGLSGCVLSSVILYLRKKKKDAFERGAMIGGYLCLVFHWAFFVWASSSPNQPPEPNRAERGGSP